MSLSTLHIIYSVSFYLSSIYEQCIILYRSLMSTLHTIYSVSFYLSSINEQCIILYRSLMSTLHIIDPETSHNLTIKLLSNRLVPRQEENYFCFYYLKKASAVQCSKLEYSAESSIESSNVQCIAVHQSTVQQVQQFNRKQ